MYFLCWRSSAWLSRSPWSLVATAPRLRRLRPSSSQPMRHSRRISSVQGSSRPALKTSPSARPVSGIVTAVYVKWGDRVKSGTPLFKVDTRDLEAQLLPANAKVKEVEAQLLPANAKVKEVEAQLLPANAKVQEAEAVLAKAENRLKVGEGL